MKNEDCNKALLRIFPKIDMNKIVDIFNEIPEEYDNLVILSKIQKDYYLKSLKYKYDILCSVYKKIHFN